MAGAIIPGFSNLFIALLPTLALVQFSLHRGRTSVERMIDIVATQFYVHPRGIDGPLVAMRAVRAPFLLLQPNKATSRPR